MGGPGLSAAFGTFFPAATDVPDMFGGGGMNPRKLQQMMEQMGIDVTEIDATEVRITTGDDEDLVFESPEVTRMDAQGQQTYQIVGEPERVAAGTGDSEPELEIPEDDVHIVADRTGAGADEARTALKETDGDLAAAIDRLS